MTPPNDPQAEKAVLGAILQAGDRMAEVGDLLEADDFYTEAHRTIYRVMHQQWGLGNIPDPIMVGVLLRDEGSGIGFSDCMMMAETLADPANIKVYAQRVINCSHKRQALSAATTLAAEAQRPESKASEIVEQAVTGLLGIVDVGLEDAGEAHITIDDVLREAQTAKTKDGAGIRTGIDCLDLVLRPWKGGQMVTLAADTGVGKTSLALQIAAHAALHGKSVMYACLEMSRHELATRLAAQLSGVPSDCVEDGRMTKDDWGRVQAAKEQLAACKFLLDGHPHLSVAALRARARARAQRHGLDLVIVDYLQLMLAARQSDNRAAEVSSVSRGVKLLASELAVPIVVLSQYSRAYSHRQDKSDGAGRLPKMSDLKESSSIEQDSHTVLLMHRECDPSTPVERQRITQVVVAKQRSGRRNVTVELAFQPETQLFSGGE